MQKIKVNNLGRSILKLFAKDNNKNSFHKIKASFYAILIGLIIGVIPILATDGNFFQTYIHMIIDPFKKFSIRYTMGLISVFALLGAGIGISFKTGLFNIGASGQFLLGGSITTMMGISLNLDKAIGIPLMLFVSAIAGALLAGIAGALKAFFNVHEVVSTILLNWIIFYILKMIFKMDQFKNSSSEASKMISKNARFDIGFNSSEIIYVILISFAIITFIWFIFKFTTFGFQLKVNGLNKDAAIYSGMNTKLITIYSMSLSGLLAGVAGFLYYSSLQKQMPAFGSSLPSIGFEAITVTLLAFSSPLGSIPAGVFYAIIKVGSNSASIFGNVSKETIDLVLGIIIFFAAMAPVLSKFKFVEIIRKQYIYYKSDKVKTKKYNNLKLIKKIKQECKLNKSEFKSIQRSEKAKISKLDNTPSIEYLKINKLWLSYRKALLISWAKEINNTKKLKFSKIKINEKINEINNEYKISISKIKIKDYKKALEISKQKKKELKSELRLIKLDEWNLFLENKKKEVNNV